MILPERQHAAQQIWSSQYRTVQHGGATDHDVASAASRNMAAVKLEFLSGEPIVAGFFVEHCVDLLEFDPIARRRQVYFQDTGVGRDTEGSQTRIGRWRVSLHPNRHFEILLPRRQARTAAAGAVSIGSVNGTMRLM